MLAIIFFCAITPRARFFCGFTSFFFATIHCLAMDFFWKSGAGKKAGDCMSGEFPGLFSFRCSTLPSGLQTTLLGSPPNHPSYLDTTKVQCELSFGDLVFQNTSGSRFFLPRVILAFPPFQTLPVHFQIPASKQDSFSPRLPLEAFAHFFETPWQD